MGAGKEMDAAAYDGILWDKLVAWETACQEALDLPSTDAPLDPTGPWTSVDERRLNCCALRVLRNIESLGRARDQSKSDLVARRVEQAEAQRIYGEMERDSEAADDPFGPGADLDLDLGNGDDELADAALAAEAEGEARLD